VPARGLQIETRDLDEAIAAVSRVYCPHALTVAGAARRVASSLHVRGGEAHPVVSLRYSAPVRIDAGRFDNLLLVKTCTQGSASATQDFASTRFTAGQTIPLSPGRATLLAFDGQFVQRSVRLDVQQIERLCAATLRQPMDAPLRFELQPFAPRLEAAWGETIALLLGLERQGESLPSAAALRLEEFLLSLLLELHPHNYSEALRRPQALATPRAVREAEHLMRTATAGEALTVAGIARAVGVSVRSLEAGFREWRQMTPTQYYRQIRLAAVRAELQRGGAATSVSAVALHHGFLHLSRFAAHYRATFGETPRQTLLRARTGR
jgi:AraC-like DNA-binding protein